MIGTKLAHYEITTHIGSGGMGDVYQASDTKLGRSVAIKFLPEAFSHESERVARFQREARVLASLNHANIAAIHGVEEINGRHFLVMELVPGDTLAERIKSGAIPIEEALPIAEQIAEALEEAHEKGIIHRDLKPANIKVTPDGKVKVLDFGLAKAYEREQADAAVSNSPTISMAASNAGMILGTAAYMSPEQARGRTLDKRTDIWAFGCVVYEMLTGTPVFRGEDVTEILAAVVKSEPDLNALPANTPASIRRLLRRCLEKDRKRRLPDAGSARLEIEDALTTPTAESLPSPAIPWLWPSIAGLLAIAALIAVWAPWRAGPVAPLLHLELTPPEGTTFGPVAAGQLSLSPDGRQLVFFASGKDGKQMLWLRALDTNAAVPVTGSENAAGQPFWSPDSRWLVFAASGKLKKIDVSTRGVAPQPICDAVGRPLGRLGTWNSEGVILFEQPGKPIQRISASGGTPVSIMEFDTAEHETGQLDPNFLPDGQRFIYMSTSGNGNVPRIMLGSLDGKMRRPLGQGAGYYAANGAGGGSILHTPGIFARAFDPTKGEYTGEDVRIADTLGNGPAFTTSDNGVLAFRRLTREQTQLTWIGRDGKALGAARDVATGRTPRISPDQKTIALVRQDVPNRSIWLADISRGVNTRFTLGLGLDTGPLWSPDGSSVFYTSSRENELFIVERPANMVGAETIVFKSDSLTTLALSGVSRDGHWLAAGAGQGGRILLIPRPSGKPITFAEGHREANGIFSPDGRWMLYTATPGNNVREVFVQSLPEEAGGSPKAIGKFQISAAGGGQPTWRGDGKEIFYVGADGKMMAVPVELGESFFRPGTPRPLFQTTLSSLSTTREYDVTPDGQRFLINQANDGVEEIPITVIVNWPRLLEK
jgi:eukaryotic-like serine/threonine-protein kinase